MDDPAAKQPTFNQSSNRVFNAGLLVKACKIYKTISDLGSSPKAAKKNCRAIKVTL